jgi:hypothetical protein
MKYRKIGLLMVIPALALVLFGVNIRPPAAHATVISVITITRTDCLTLTGNVDWNGSDSIDADDGITSLSVCNGLDNEGNFRTLTGLLGGDPDNPKPSDFAKIDLDAGQVHEKDGFEYVVAFVGNDDPVGFYADNGIFQATGRSDAFCGPAGQPGIDFQEADCDGKASTVGDGVVVIHWDPHGAPRGDGEFRVRQGSIEATAAYKVVGEPDHISLKAFDTAIQTNAPLCVLFTDTPTFLETLTEPETSPIVATVTDSDDTPITGALVEYKVDDPDLAKLAIPDPLRIALTPSVDLQALGIGSPEVICGGEKAGTVKITATLTTGSDVLPGNLGLDPSAPSRSASITLPVQSEPTTMMLSAVPPNLVCDGSATSSVSANLNDDSSKPVVNGNLVHFTVEALGSVNPIGARSASGVATTVLTPLSGVVNGVLVRATWMRHVTKGPTPTPVFTPLAPTSTAAPDLGTPGPGTPTPVPTSTSVPTQTPAPVATAKPLELQFVASDLEQSMLVNCDQNPATVGEQPAAGAPASVISPPSTGGGGSQQSSWLVALPLGAVALLLVGSGLALRRRRA